VTTTASEPGARLSAFLPAELKRELEQLAERNERSVGGEVRLALRRHLDQEITTAGSGERALGVPATH